MCGHIIHENESKLVRWGIKQAKEASQNNKGGLHKDLPKYLHKELHKDLHKFRVSMLKIVSDALVEMGVTKPSVITEKKLQNHQMGSTDKWYPPKHQGWCTNSWIKLNNTLT